MEYATMKKKKIVSITLVSVVLVALSACNTFEGLGKDIQNLGRNLEHSADTDKNQ
jgi:predicted small secreted protein